jgi:hypothetical protein
MKMWFDFNIWLFSNQWFALVVIGSLTGTAIGLGAYTLVLCNRIVNLLIGD